MCSVLLEDWRLNTGNFQRCDGTRPVCSPCNTMKRSQECRYDDSGRKSRTQTLREKKAALEARVLVLEREAKPRRSMSLPSAASTWPRAYSDELVDPQYQDLTVYPLDMNIWNTREYDAPLHTNDGSPYSLQFDNPIDCSLRASPSGSYSLPAMSNQLDGSLSILMTGQPSVGSMRAFSDSSGTSVQDGMLDRLLYDMSPSPITSREMHDVL